MAVPSTPYFREESEQSKKGYGLQLDARCYRLYNFKTASETLETGHQQALQQHVLSALLDAGMMVWAVGHASRRGDVAYNQALSERRAAAVRKFLAQFGKEQQVYVAARGETATIGTDENDPLDRAVVLVVQAASLPKPPFITSGPPWVGGMAAVSGRWRIAQFSGAPLKAPGMKVGIVYRDLVLERPSTAQVARYRVSGVSADVGIDLKQVPGVGTLLDRLKSLLSQAKGMGLKVPGGVQLGSEIVTSPRILDPIAETFAGSIAVFGPSSGVVVGASLALVIFSEQALTSVLAWNPLNLKGFGTVSTQTLALGAGVDTIHGQAMLSSVSTSMGASL